MKQRYVKRFGVKDKRFKGVQSKMYYIVDLKDYHKPKVIAKFFDTKKQAKFCIEKYFKADFKRYEVVKGKHLLEDPIKWASRYNPPDEKITKYDYPADCITPKQRHRWRVKRRVRLGLKKKTKKGKL
jgi:hypothetical protein